MTRANAASASPTRPESAYAWPVARHAVASASARLVAGASIEVGRAPAVHDIRTSFQSAMRDQFTQVVESALGRRVRAYLSQVHTDPDVAVELFLLEPEGGPSGEVVAYEEADPA